MSVSICIATYLRNEQLSALLGDLATQEQLPDQVVVVDNDVNGGARGVVERHRASGVGYRIEYDTQPLRNIALTRNRTVQLADCDWLAFIDDDERAPADWLRRLLQAAERYHADGVLAPVEPQLPQNTPAWMTRGRFYDYAHQPSGAVVPLNRMRFGNVLLRAATVRAQSGPFDESYGLMHGEDSDMLVRLARAGARIVWDDEAPVFEPVEPRRLSLRWLLVRAFSGGQTFARQSLDGMFGPIGWSGRWLLLLRAVLQLLAAAALTLVSWPFGLHRAANWLIKAGANLGKVSAYSGWRYRAYA